jgi:DNA-binding CsgD family transcriptional regulator
VTGTDTRVVARETELATLRAFLDAAISPRSLVLTGGPGIGKTTLWVATIDMAREQGSRVLVARPSSAEAQLSFAALVDLCEGVRSEELAALSAPQRRALGVALLRLDPGDAHPEPHAIALGFLNALRALAEQAPLVIAVDDIQWLDTPSAEVLSFAVRRLGPEPIRFLLAERSGSSSPLTPMLERANVERVEVGPLSFGALRRLLSERLGLSLSRQLLHRLVELTLGNPLFALESGRVLLERGIPESGDALPLPGGIEDMLGTRVASLAGDVRRLLVAVALSGEPQLREVAAVESEAALEAAVKSGVVEVDGDRVRASHPLLAAVARAGSPREEQRELHLALAGAVTDHERRAMHLALATQGADGELAGAVASAASSAFARGARQPAVSLAEHALRLTPAASPDRTERVLALAEYLEAAGELGKLNDLLAPEVAALPSGRARARALLMLSEGAGPKHVDELERYREQALEECGDDPALRARVLAKRSANFAASFVSRIAEAEAWGVEAVTTAREAAPEVERLALYGLAWARAMTGRPIDDLCESSRAASDASSTIAGSPERVAAQRLVWRGEVSQARPALARFLSLADQRGERESYALQRLHLIELHLRVGEWTSSERLLDEWAESTDRELMFRPKYERCRALLAAGRGEREPAQTWATQAISLAEETGCRWDGLEGQRALGMADLLGHAPESAARHLRIVWQHTVGEGVDEPGVFPVAPELVEALAELTELDEACAVAARLRELAELQSHPWGLASAERCEGLVALTERYDEPAAERVEQAASAYERLGLTFEAGRSRLSLGRAQRRFKKWGVARRSLERATATFEAIGSDGWAAEARSELSRVGARPPRATGELTDMERRTAELASSGLSNKEIAGQLFVTVHTVEVHLSRAYAKLGIRSRGQLAHRLSA